LSDVLIHFDSTVAIAKLWIVTTMVRYDN